MTRPPVAESLAKLMKGLTEAMTSDELAKKSGYHRNTVTQALKLLHESKPKRVFIERREDRWAYWRLGDQPDATHTMVTKQPRQHQSRGSDDPQASNPLWKAFFSHKGPQ